MSGSGDVVSEFVYKLLKEQQEAKVVSAQGGNGHDGDDGVKVSPKVATVQRMKSKRVDKTNYNLLMGAVDLLNLTDSYGVVNEFLIKSPSIDFSIILNVDDEAEYQRTWTEMSALSDDVDSIVASLQNGFYILNMSDIHFSNNVKITVVGQGIVFTKLYVGVKYGKLD